MDEIDWNDLVSHHFAWWEVVATGHRDLRDQNRDYLLANPEIQENVRKVANEIMEPIRRRCGVIHVNSWVRCHDLNLAVGGSVNSDHLKGLAVDFVCPQLRLDETWARVRQILPDLPFGQLIREPLTNGRDAPDSWLHISYKTAAHQGEVIS